jgi:hypothetical protein
MTNAKLIRAKIKKCLSETNLDAQLAVLTEGLALEKDRIFNKSLTTELNSMGKYRSESYLVKKKKAGRLTPRGASYLESRKTARGYNFDADNVPELKNLQFTKQLRDDFVVGTSKGKAVIGFKTDRSAEIAKHQEDKNGNQIGESIFKVNSDTVDFIIDRYKEVIIEKTKECLLA